MDDEDSGCLVIDIGTSNIRVGLSGDDDPLKILDPKGSVNNGAISDFDGIKQILHTAIKEIRASESDAPSGEGDSKGNDEEFPFSLMISEIANNSRSNRKKTLEICFESLKSHGVLLIPSVLLTLYSYGKQTGSVIEMGHGAVQIATVVDTQLVGTKTAVYTEKYTGQALTRQLVERIKFSEKVCNDIKEKHLFVSESAGSKGTSEVIDYKLPDNKIIHVEHSDLFEVGESLFQSTGIHNILVDSISKTDEKVAPSLYRTILFGGGGSMINGLKNRFTNEVKKQSGQEYVTVFATPNRRLSTWIGGSMLGGTGAYEE